MNLPEGRLVRSHVVADPRTPLAAALDRELTGYAIFEPQETLLLDGRGQGILTFRDGVPDMAYFTGTDRGGPAALGDLAMPGPYHVELYELPGSALDSLTDTEPLTVPPGMPAERLAGDPALAASTRRGAPAARTCADADDQSEPGTAADGRTHSAVEAFLDDDEKIAAIRDRARAEAEAKAAEWDLD
jgi:hypothetical protein